MEKTYKKIPRDKPSKSKDKSSKYKIKNYKPILKEIDIEDDISEYGDYVSNTIEDYTKLNNYND